MEESLTSTVECTGC